MTSREDIDLIRSEIVLPNGRKISNRMVKAAMEEGIGHTGGCPGPNHRQLYSTWAEGGWGTIITGNVQVDRRHLATPHDRFIPDSSPSTISAYAQLHQSMISASSSSSDVAPPRVADGVPLTLVQLSHPGLQASSIISLARWPWTPALAPIAARPDLGSTWLGNLMGYLVWPIKSRRLSVDEWMEIVDQFVRAARVVEEAGWGGVQIHSAHGYLLAEYLSPHTNPDPQPLSGVPEEIPIRLHLLYLILYGIHTSTQTDFVLSVKINCSDFVQGGLDEDQAAEIVKIIVSWGIIDILEVSGGTYASPAFAAPETIGRPSTHVTRQSLFAHFTTSLLPHLPPPPAGPAILLTGGLHDRSLIAASLRDRACDLVGIGRPACVKPRLPLEVILNPGVSDQDTYLGGYNIRGAELIKGIFGGTSKPGKRYSKGATGDKNEMASASGIPLVGAGVSTFWHEMQLNRLGRGLEPDVKIHWVWGLFVEFIWFGIFGGGPLNWFKP